MNNVTFTIYKSPDPLSKRYYLEDGLIQKQASAQIYRGTAERVTIPFADFAQALSQATENQAFGYGLHPFNLKEIVKIVVNGKEKPEQNIISRTQKFYEYKNEPGVLMLDHDPSEYGKAMSPDELIQKLIDIYPAIGAAARIIRGSVSSGIHKTGKQPTTGKGFHIYIPVKNATDIPRFGKLLVNKLWLKGFGFIALAANGALLERAEIDVSVFSPERLDFVGKPILLDEGLEYTPPETTYIEGDLLDTQSLFDLTDDEVETVNKLKSDAKNAIQQAAAEKKAQWAEVKVNEMLAKGTPIEAAQELIKQILSGECQDLYGDFPLEFVTGIFSVAHVLANLKEFDGKTLADPIEGKSYGTTTAKLYSNNGYKPVIHSFAHGQNTKYFLHHKAPLKTVDTSPHNDVLDGHC